MRTISFPISVASYHVNQNALFLYKNLPANEITVYIRSIRAGMRSLESKEDIENNILKSARGIVSGLLT